MKPDHFCERHVEVMWRGFQALLLVVRVRLSIRKSEVEFFLFRRRKKKKHVPAIIFYSTLP